MQKELSFKNVNYATKFLHEFEFFAFDTCGDISTRCTVFNFDYFVHLKKITILTVFLCFNDNSFSNAFGTQIRNLVILIGCKYQTTNGQKKPSFRVHSKKRTTCSGLMKTALNNVVLPTLFNVVNNTVQHC